MRTIFLALAVNILCVSSAAAAQQPVWDELLRQYVHEGRVDYQGWSTERSLLEHYLEGLGLLSLTTGSWTRNGQLAFWINAYNACVIKGVLDHYPITSVKDVKGFFDKTRYQVAGESLTLNEIEAKGRALGDWRIHMAVVCGAWSCPPLRSEAYVPERLDEQLADQVRRFLNDPQRGLRLEGSTLWASKIFDWYRKDFVVGRLDIAALLRVVHTYAPEGFLAAAEGRSLQLKFLNYDWSLNRQP